MTCRGICSALRQSILLGVAITRLIFGPTQHVPKSFKCFFCKGFTPYDKVAIGVTLGTGITLTMTIAVYDLAKLKQLINYRVPFVFGMLFLFVI